MNVLIVDDHELVRTGIRRLLEDNSNIKVIAEAASGEEAVEMAKTYSPDVILMDIYMPGIGGLEATHKILLHSPDQKIIILTAHSEGPLPKTLLEAGAVGYLTKGCAVEEMVAAIKQVSRGQKYIAPEIAQKMALSMVAGSENSPFERLTQRELQIVMMITQGLRTQDISDTLCLSPKTVSTYRSRIMSKLGVESGIELVKLAIQHGLTEQEPVS